MSDPQLECHTNYTYWVASPRVSCPSGATTRIGSGDSGNTLNTMTSTPRENTALVQGFLTDYVARGDTDAVEVFLAEDPVEHDLVFGDIRDCETVAPLGWRVLAGADVSIDIETLVATDEEVAVRAVVSGTHRESLVDLAPTGAAFEIDYAWFCRIDGGRISEICSLPDGLGLMTRRHTPRRRSEPFANRFDRPSITMIPTTTNLLDVSSTERSHSDTATPEVSNVDGA